ncbi:MAG TPA: hypothetical protein VFF86_05130 [Candidatus Methylomirabilis sp.]|nr:hypothetical protein [Candidatus Methylomirabilis sp.]
MALTIRHFWPDLNAWLGELPDTRFAPLVVYDRKFMAWWGMALFMFKLGSRRQLDFDLRDPSTEILANLNRLAGTTQETLPVDGTLDHFLGHLGSEPLMGLRAQMVRRLIRMKALDDARLRGHFVVAVDGSGWMTFRTRHCDRCLTQQHGDTVVYLHLILEAKLVGPQGTALSIGTEFVENAKGGSAAVLPDTQEAKQDCELMALERLAPVLKAQFPQLLLCLSSDSLYACGRALLVARNNDWRFVFTFKEGRLPKAWEEFERLRDLSPENALRLTLPDGTLQLYRWVNGMSYEDSDHRLHAFNALECLETAKGVTTRFAWLTDFPLSPTTVADVAMKGGRSRSRIENEGFNVQKNSLLSLEHPYSMDLEKQKAYYLLLQIAHLILQMLEKGSLLRRLVRKAGQSAVDLFGSLKNIARRLLEAFRYARLPDEAFAPLAAASIQIRLDTC